jgi:hypothetical protein
MKQRRSTARARPARRRNYRSGAYVAFCVGVVAAAAGLTFSGFVLPPRALPSTETPAPPRISVATIQLSRDEKGLCRQLLFHNDSGRFDEGGFGECRGLIPDHMLVETLSGKRNEAISKAFKFR